MTETSAAVDSQAAAGAPEANQSEDAPSSMPTAEAVAEGARDPGLSTNVAYSDRGVVSLAPAPMPQFEMVRSQGFGAEPVYPEGHEEFLAGLADAVGVQNFQADNEIVASNPAIAELFENADAEDLQSTPTMAGSSQDSSVVATGGDTGTSNPQTGVAATPATGTGTTPSGSSTSGSGSSTSGSGSGTSSGSTQTTP